MRGEGEYLINELMDYFENGDISLQDIDGITYLDLNGNIVKIRNVNYWKLRICIPILKIF